MTRLPVSIAALAALAFVAYVPLTATAGAAQLSQSNVSYKNPSTLKTATPIKHLVVLYQENVSFDHYFGTYPHAANKPGETKWVAKPGTPSVNGLTPALLYHNPNLYNPVRLNAQQALTCDQDHNYTAEQMAEDKGLMDKFVQNTTGSPYSAYEYCPKDIALGYYDGNVVTGLWNYAQHFVLGDNSWGTNFGPSTPGALNLVTGDTGTALCGPSSAVINSSPCGKYAALSQRSQGDQLWRLRPLLRCLLE